MSLLADLNPKQRRAVKLVNGPLLVIAGPGTGKTKTLTSKILFLLLRQNIPANRLLALTFTQKAGREIQERLDQSLNAVSNIGPKSSSVSSRSLPFVGTFHALGHYLLAKHHPNFKQFDTKIPLISEKERAQLIRELIKTSPSRSLFKKYKPRQLSLIISRAKSRLIPQSGPEKELVAAYNQALRAKNQYDYDDLLQETYQLLKNDRQLRRRLSQQFRFILIDEFQDTSPLQYELIKLILDEPFNLCAIGDPLQAIYSFRGASAQAFEQFQKDFPGAQTINLDINYRSAANIIATSHCLFPDSPALKPAASIQASRTSPKAKPKSRPKPGLIRQVTTLNEHTEADWIIAQISQQVGGVDFRGASDHQNQSDQKTGFNDFAVIYRMHRSGQALKRKLKESGLPYQVAGGDAFWAKPAVTTIIEGLADLENPDQSLTQLAAQIQNQAKLPDQEALDELQSALLAFEEEGSGRPATDLQKFLAYYEKIAQTDFYDPDADKITLSTMHAAKGLEFKHVFVAGFEDGLIPYLKKDTNLAEEKRLLYVACTRAKQNLDLLYAPQRFRQRGRKISRFANLLADAPLEKVEDERLAKLKKKWAQKRAQEQQTQLF